jgi:hypothetical protein
MDLESPDLNTGIILAIISVSGKIPSTMEVLMICVKTSTMSDLQDFTI